MTHRKKAGLLLGGLCIVGAIAASIIAFRAARAQTCVLPDGATVTLVSDSFGTHHVLKMRGKSFWQLIRPPQPVMTWDTDQDSLVLFLSYTKNGHAGTTKGANGASWWDWIEVTDTSGNAYRTVNPDTNGQVWVADGPYISTRSEPQTFFGEGIQLTKFPHRCKSIVVRFYKTNVSAPIAGFEVPNERFVSYPVWKSEALPDTHVKDEVAFTLRRLTKGAVLRMVRGVLTSPNTPAVSSAGKAAPGTTENVIADFDASRGGRKLKNWTAMRYALSDATGNCSAPVFNMGMFDDDAISLEAEVAPLGTELQKLRVEFVANETTKFPNGILWSPHTLAVPNRKSFTTLNETWTRYGTQFRVMGIGGPGQYHWGTQDWESMDSPYYFVRVAYAPTSAALQVMFRATDETGHAAKCVGDNQKYWIRCAEPETPLSFQSEFPPQPPTVDENLPPDQQELIRSMNKDAMNPIVVVANSPNSEGFGTCPEGTAIRTFFFTPPPGSHSLKLTFAVARSEFVDYIINVASLPIDRNN